MDLISQLVMLEKRNLYHNDLRVWNIILVKSNEVSLIDFGAISESKKIVYGQQVSFIHLSF